MQYFSTATVSKCSGLINTARQPEHFTTGSMDYYTCPGSTISCPQPELMTTGCSGSRQGGGLMGGQVRDTLKVDH